MRTLIASALVALGICQPALAGTDTLTMFSRANCLGVNESISWDGRGMLGDEAWQYNLSTESRQIQMSSEAGRAFYTGFEITGRSRAACQFCGNDWTVAGSHFATVEGIANTYKSAQSAVLEDYCDGWHDAGATEAIPCWESMAVDCNLGEF